MPKQKNWKTDTTKKTKKNRKTDTTKKTKKTKKMPVGRKVDDNAPRSHSWKEHLSQFARKHPDIRGNTMMKAASLTYRCDASHSNRHTQTGEATTDRFHHRLLPEHLVDGALEMIKFVFTSDTERLTHNALTSEGLKKHHWEFPIMDVKWKFKSGRVLAPSARRTEIQHARRTEIQHARRTEIQHALLVPERIYGSGQFGTIVQYRDRNVSPSSKKQIYYVFKVEKINSEKIYRMSAEDQSEHNTQKDLSINARDCGQILAWPIQSMIEASGRQKGTTQPIEIGFKSSSTRYNTTIKSMVPVPTMWSMLSEMNKTVYDVANDMNNSTNNNEIKMNSILEIVEEVRKQIACISRSTGRKYTDLKARNVLYSEEQNFKLGDLGSAQNMEDVYRNGVISTYHCPNILLDRAWLDTTDNLNSCLNYQVSTFLLELMKVAGITPDVILRPRPRPPSRKGMRILTGFEIEQIVSALNSSITPGLLVSARRKAIFDFIINPYNQNSVLTHNIEGQRVYTRRGSRANTPIYKIVLRMLYESALIAFPVVAHSPYLDPPPLMK